MAGLGKAACCWTCKIRHVKCDATPSACLQCTSRQVHCHGYGPMPSWMDGGENEKEQKQRIKLAVKKNFKEKKSLQAHQRRGHTRAIRRGQNLSRAAKEVIEVNKTSQRKWCVMTAMRSYLTLHQVLSGQSFPKPLEYGEADLLMHYLDHVFPYQYPFFDKGKWSRGWLLWLLSKNGPLCRASLGLAALHQRSLLGETNNHHIELEFHTKAVRQLHDFLLSIDINELRPDNEILVEIITCGVTLISFEIHDQLQSPIFESRATAVMAFHIPVLLWMDLLACVATREKAKLPYNEWLGPSCNFQLAHIMGCHNSVMKSIGDLAALSHYKLNSLPTDSFDTEEFEKTRQNIEDELENAIESTPMALIEFRGLSPYCVTRIFAAAALVQLDAVSAEVSKDITSTRMRRAVSRVILEIKMANQMVSPRQLSWPICVAGCMADQDQQPFFEALLDGVLSKGTGMIGNCVIVRDILRTSWKNKVGKPNEQWDCSNTMQQMDICALLI
ncbi:fungal-specific transcription factor domain-containing protein [Fusarium venenatum]|uniref:fungal-specific transcription factor domain-containing protein n=1 Tax=Fusarium venenatum TaxID=56646 RepID=UPI001DF3E0F0|nr:fungal-specific transcription factor domain-containing protein [Fusarium venenatum]